ncbi:unnamed protein product [Lota lota]
MSGSGARTALISLSLWYDLLLGRVCYTTDRALRYHGRGPALAEGSEPLRRPPESEVRFEPRPFLFTVCNPKRFIKRVRVRLEGQGQTGVEGTGRASDVRPVMGPEELFRHIPARSPGPAAPPHHFSLSKQTPPAPRPPP